MFSNGAGSGAAGSYSVPFPMGRPQLPQKTASEARDSPHPWQTDCTGIVSPPSLAPHSAQNIAPGRFRLPHLAQISPAGLFPVCAPQLQQNSEPGLISCPQFGQYIRSSLRHSSQMVSGSLQHRNYTYKRTKGLPLSYIPSGLSLNPFFQK